MATDQIYRPVVSSTMRGSFSYICSDNTISTNYGITYPTPPPLRASPSTVLLINAQGFRCSAYDPMPGAVRYIVVSEAGRISRHDDPPYNAYQLFELSELMSNENQPVYREVAWRPQPAEKPKRILDL